MRKTPKDILNVKEDERHIWLLSADIKELTEFLTLVTLDNKWSGFGRDALNILLAKENVQLQTDIRDMTKQLHRLTVFIAILALIQLYPSCKTIYADIKTLLNPTKCESTLNQTTKTNQLDNKNSQMLEKNKAKK